jgi:YbbR domain-containing protein
MKTKRKNAARSFGGLRKMKKEFSFSRMLESDRFVRLLSVVVAIIIWFIVAYNVDPNKKDWVNEIVVDMDLTDTTPEANHLSVIDVEQDKVRVQVEGKRYRISNLKPEDFVAEPELGRVNKPGEYDIKVNIKKANDKDDDFKIISSLPVIKVKFDVLVTKEFPITALAENIKAEEGYIKEKPYTNFNTLILKGPATEIDKINSVVVSTDHNEVVNNTVTLKGDLYFYDKDNNPVELTYTTYEKQRYEITVAIFKLKTVPLKVNYINIPPGFDTSKIKYTLSTPELEIAGPANLIDEIKEITLDGEVDFRKIDIGYAQDLGVSLVAGITNVDNITSVTATFDDENLSSSFFSVSNIITKNEPANYTIKLKTNVINNVKIVGNKYDIEKLSANDLIASVDLSKVTAGTTRITVQIYATGNKVVWAVGEYSVLVTATKK